MSAPKRIVCYAINGAGLGHLTRLISVARWLRRYVALLDNKAPEVLFLTSSDASDALADVGFAAFKIPSKEVAKRAELDKLEYRRLAKHFVWNTLGVFAPDLLVVDTFPSGSFDELFQVLDGPFKKGFIYRDVKPEYAARATFRSAIGMYDTVVVPHRQGSHEYAPMPSVETTNCGEVVQFERQDLLPPDVVRQRLGAGPHERIVYLSAGGGGDPECEQTLESLVNACRARRDVHLLVGAGPLYRGKRWFAPNLTWFDTTGVWKYFGAVDAAVSAGGYNTFHELLFAQVPAAFFAQPKIADDQAQRIALAADAGACLSVSDVHDRVGVLQTLDALLDEHQARQIRQGCQDFLLDNGARTCALKLLRPLYSDGQLAWAGNVLTPSIGLALEQLCDNSSAGLSSWLTTLLPHHQVQMAHSHLGVASVLERLSPEAAREVEALLYESEPRADLSEFEADLLILLKTIQSKAAENPLGDGPQYLADDVLKTLAAVIKKQPLEAARNGNYIAWIRGVIQAVVELLQESVEPLTLSDTLQLYRIFPRIVDASARESLELFREYLMDRQAKCVSTTEVYRHLQVMKVSNAKLTKAALRGTWECAQQELP